MNARFRIAAALALTGLWTPLSWAAPRPAHRTESKQALRQPPVRVRIETYTTRTHFVKEVEPVLTGSVAAGPTAYSDPIVAHLSGVPHGGSVTVESIGIPKRITLPKSPSKDASPAEREAYHRELQSRIAGAQQRKVIAFRGPQEVRSGGRVTFEEAVTVPARTPLEVRVVDGFGRARSLRTEAVGEKYTTAAIQRRAMEFEKEGVGQSEPMRWTNRITERGGLLGATYKPEVQTHNLRVSKPFIKDNTSYVSVFSAAAFAGKTKNELEAWAEQNDIPLAPVNSI